MKKEEVIYNTYKGYDIPQIPKKVKGSAIIFNPYLEYHKQKSFFELNLNNFIRLLKLLIFNPDWFTFFMTTGQPETLLDWSITNHNKVDNTLKKRMGILFFLFFVILSLIPIILCLVYSQIGILELISPSQQLTIFHFLLVESFISPLFFSASAINDDFKIFPIKGFDFLVFVISKKKILFLFLLFYFYYFIILFIFIFIFIFLFYLFIYFIFIFFTF